MLDTNVFAKATGLQRIAVSMRVQIIVVLRKTGEFAPKNIVDA